VNVWHSCGVPEREKKNFRDIGVEGEEEKTNKQII
jgi:hypothetical protein